MKVVMWYDETTLEHGVIEMKEGWMKERKNLQLLAVHLVLTSPYYSTHISTLFIRALFVFTSQGYILLEILQNLNYIYYLCWVITQQFYALFAT
jgi:hypothetical protein